MWRHSSVIMHFATCHDHGALTALVLTDRHQVFQQFLCLISTVDTRKLHIWNGQSKEFT